MKRFLPATLLITSAFLYQSAQAQLKGFSIGPYAEVGWPAGGFQQTNKNGIGVGLSADIKLPASFGITGSAGYMQFPGKTVNTQEGNLKYDAVKAYPIRIGIKYRILPILYLKFEGGSANFTKGDGTAFIASPAIGLRVLGIDIQGKYETWFRDGEDVRFWAVKAGFNF